uniref:Coiled-coil domain-containing protein 25 n=1 Tax=Panagrolaimus davidi TaxID=227884 RepID=A0A914PIL0_9BILA
MWENLKKTGDMVVGQVGFKSQKAVKKMKVEKKNNDILNRLNKTKVVDDKIDYRLERERRDTRERQKEREQQKILKEKERAEKDAIDREKAAYSYENVFANAEMTTNQSGYESDDFM